MTDKTGWQPIESAPMDFGKYLFITKSGRYRVDGYNKKQFDIQACRPRWSEAPRDPYTHWMPLPPEPKQ